MFPCSHGGTQESIKISFIILSSDFLLCFNSIDRCGFDLIFLRLNSLELFVRLDVGVSGRNSFFQISFDCVKFFIFLNESNGFSFLHVVTNIGVVEVFLQVFQFGNITENVIHFCFDLGHG